MKDAVRRLRDGIKVAWDKSKIDASITSLRSSNDDLRRLRQQAIELQKPVTQLKDTKKRVAQEYVEYKLIRRASKALHAALSTAWSSRVASCAGDTVRHDVKLFVDAKVKDGVLMNMTVLCFGSHTLYVRLS
jgi:hypothetical protein